MKKHTQKQCKAYDTEINNSNLNVPTDINILPLIENAHQALIKLNESLIKKKVLISLLESFVNRDLLQDFVFQLKMSNNIYRKSIRSLYRKEKKVLIDKIITNKCKLRAVKKQEKRLITNQLLSIEQNKHDLTSTIHSVNDPEMKIDSICETSDENEYRSDVKVPINHRSKKISKNNLLLNPFSSSDTLPLKRKCYVCKKIYSDLHNFYDRMCKDCGDFNYEKRNQKCDFNNRIALITGCRIKIGYEIALYLLRNNCKVIGTTRFPKDAFERFSKEKDFDSFKDNLVIYPLNLRNLSVLDKFIKHLYNTIPKLDILINNAAQTIRRAPIFYQNLLVNETKPLEDFKNLAIYRALPQDFGSLDCNSQNGYKLQIQNDEINSEITLEKNIADNISASTLESLVPLTYSDLNPNLQFFPQGVVDKDNQQVDLSTRTSWNKNIEEIDFLEFAETQVVNSWAPWQLCSKLKDLMAKSENTYKFIINVSSMEGKFNRFKNSTHPHTNMSKASLNMMTRTCGSHYAKINILMNSVDTGWVSEMIPSNLLLECKTVPLDEIDGAMRVLDPIIQTINKGETQHSLFLKDYKQTEW